MWEEQVLSVAFFFGSLIQVLMLKVRGHQIPMSRKKEGPPLMHRSSLASESLQPQGRKVLGSEEIDVS